MMHAVPPSRLPKLLSFLLNAVVAFQLLGHLSSVSAETNNCRAGGSSYGVAFDQSRADVVSLHGVTMPTNALTVEYWFRNTNLNTDYQTVLSYSVRGFLGYNDANSDDVDQAAEVYESANELQLGVTPKYLRVWRGRSVMDLSNKTNPKAASYKDGWRHYAVSIDSANDGEVALYLDGEFLDLGHASIEIPAASPEEEGAGGFIGVDFENVEFSNGWNRADNDDAKKYYGRRQVAQVVVCTSETSNEEQEQDDDGNPGCGDKSLSCDLSSVMNNEDQAQEEVKWVALLRQAQTANGRCSANRQARNAADLGAWVVILAKTEEEGREGDRRGGIFYKPLSVPVLAVEPSLLDKVETGGYIALTRTRQTYLPGTDFQKSIVQRGVLHLGQEPDRPWGDFDDMQAADGVLDEYRMWRTVRTPEEIRANFRTSIEKSTADASDLYVYWTFDAEPESHENKPHQFTADSSPGGENPGLIGSLPTIANEMQYTTNRPNMPPTIPRRILTTSSPIVGGGEVVVPVAPGGQVVFELKSFDPDKDDLVTIVRTLPLVGELFALVAINDSTGKDDGNDVPDHAGEVVLGDALGANDVVQDGNRTESKRIVYRAPTDLNMSSFAPGVTFTYSVSDGGDPVEATVRLVCHQIDQPASRVITTSEDELVYLTLSAPSQLTQANMRVEITSIPQRGHLYQAQFNPRTYPSYTSLSTSVNEHGPMEPIDTNGTILVNDRGIVMYQPEKNGHSDTHNKEYSFFTFRHVDTAAGLNSSEARISVIVTPVNDPPAGVQGSVVVSYENTTVIQLNSTDADADAAESFSDRTFARIVSFPRGGRIYQYNETALNGTAINGTDELVDDAVPQTFAWASRVIRFSSQYSICGSDCFAWMHPDCTSNDILAGGREYGTCSETSWHASKILGEPDVFPAYGDNKKQYEPSQEKFGHEWIELEFPFPIYITAFDLYETFKPGSVWRISTTEEYKDDISVPCTGTDLKGLPRCTNATSWTILWTKPQEYVTPAPEVSHIFAPPLCPSTTKTQIVRIDFDTSRVLGWNGFDAAKVTGSLQPPPELLFDRLNRLIYIPLDGVHGTDWLSFTATDCLDEGNTTNINITILPPKERGFSSSVFWEQDVELDVDASPNDIVEHELELSDVLEKIKALIGVDPNVTGTVWYTTALGASAGEKFKDITLHTRTSITIELGTETVIPEKLELWLEDKSGLTFRLHIKVAIYVACLEGKVDEAHGVCVCRSRRWTGDSCAIQVAENKNELSPVAKGFGFAMFSINMALCILFFVIITTKRRERHVKAMQPFYLYLLLFGCVISTCTIVSLLVEESDAACASIPWLWSVGFSTILGSLFTKILRVFLIFRSGERMRRKPISVKETAGIVAITVALNAIVLISWTIIDPMQWMRSTIEENEDRYVLSSYGRCSCNNCTPYLVTLAALQGTFMLLAGILCYKARHIPTTFQEGQYVGLTILCCIQLFIIGVPVLLIVREDPNVSIFVESALVFLSTLLVLLLVFGRLAYKVYFGEADETRRLQFAVGMRGGKAVASLRRFVTGTFRQPSLPAAMNDKAQHQSHLQTALCSNS